MLIPYVPEDIVQLCENVRPQFGLASLFLEKPRESRIWHPDPHPCDDWGSLTKFPGTHWVVWQIPVVRCPSRFGCSYNYFIDTDHARVQFSTSLQPPTTMVDISATIVDIPRTQGALLLGGLFSAGYLSRIQNKDLGSSRSVSDSQVLLLYKLSCISSYILWTFRSLNFWYVLANFASYWHFFHFGSL